MTGPAARIAAQAKINLHLRILSKEATGFHSIETIFHRIDLVDELAVRPTDGERTLEVAGDDLGPIESNLAWRAATAYAALAGWPRGFRVELTKHIPVGAGLGGGSADAAGVLRALDFLSPNPIGATGLLQLGTRLGADVAFLLSDAAMALAWGRGDRMLALKPLPQRDVMLVSPHGGVSTADAYRWFDDDRAHDDAVTGSRLNINPILDAEGLAAWESIASFATNDFEAPVFSRMPSLRDELERLRMAGVTMAAMTGSGSTLFAVADAGASITPPSGPDVARVNWTTTSVRVVPPVSVD